MFKNLIRFRLLDFFELTAAIGGALYVYQSGWWEFEKLWVIGALSLSAIVVWVATRFGKTSSTPGIFLAVYSGALFGLSDLSPWMAIFGRVAVIETFLSFYSANVEVGGLQERCISTAVVAGLMTIPAVLFGVTWLTICNLKLLLRKKDECPKSKLAIFFAGSQFSLAFLFVAGGGFYLFRPQIRHVRTIRIPFTFVKTTNPSIAAEPFDEAPFICDWSISNTGGKLYLLKSNKQFVEVDSSSGEVLSSVQLEGQEFRSKRQYLGAGDNRKRLSILEASGTRSLLWSFVNLTVYEGSANGPLLLVSQNGQVQLFEGKTGMERNDLTKLPLIPAYILSTSPNHRFAVLTGTNKGIGGLGQIVLDMRDMSVLSKSNYVSASPNSGSYPEFYVTDTGEMTALSKPGAYFGRGFDSKKEIEQMFCAPSLRDCGLKCSAGGAWRLSSGGLTAKTEGTNLLKSYMDYNLHAAMDHSSGKVILLHNSMEPSFEIHPEPVPPILFTLLSQANRDQLTLFDPTTKTSHTSWLRPHFFQIPDSLSTKFTPDGRHLIIQDEDDTADLFHIFAMP